METLVQNARCRSPKPNRNLSYIKAAKVLAVIFILLITILLRSPQSARLYVNDAIRELIKTYTVAGAWNLDKITSEHFYIKFKPEDRTQAELVLATAERFYRPVARDFGFTPKFKIPIILYSNQKELDKSFGWESNVTAEGVYCAGTIRVLSPKAWVDATDPVKIKKTFTSTGPMAHEFTHLMVDYLAGGNYPRWFTEGVAQYEEYKVTGFEFNTPAGSLNQPLYSMSKLTADFDNLPNQFLAYRESLFAVRFIVDQYGEGALYDLMKQLGQGVEFNQAMQNVTHLNTGQFEARWQEWAQKVTSNTPR